MAPNTKPVPSGGMKWLSGLAALLGIALLVSPFVLEATTTAMWNNGVVGAAVLILAGYNYWRIASDRAMMIGAMALVGILGLWSIIAPFAFEIGSEALLWANVTLGILVLLFAGAVVNAGRKVGAQAPTPAE